MPTVICVANQKGGIGKTTTATAVASILNEKGHPTLIIDSDLQCNTTDTYRASFEGVETLYDVLLDDKPANINDVIQHTEMGDIVAADPLLREADSKLSTKGIAGYKVLTKALSKLRGYEYVIMTADRYGFQGLYELNISIRDAEELNENLKIAGVLLVRFNKRTILAREVRETLEREAEEMGTKLFNTTIRECNKVKESQTMQSTLIKYDRSCTAAKDYASFVDELLEEVK